MANLYLFFCHWRFLPWERNFLFFSKQKTHRETTGGCWCPQAGKHPRNQDLRDLLKSLGPSQFPRRWGEHEADKLWFCERAEPEIPLSQHILFFFFSSFKPKGYMMAGAHCEEVHHNSSAKFLARFKGSHLCITQASILTHHTCISTSYNAFHSYSVSH